MLFRLTFIVYIICLWITEEIECSDLFDLCKTDTFVRVDPVLGLAADLTSSAIVYMVPVDHEVRNFVC